CEGWRQVDEDASPAGFDFVRGGVRPLPPYKVYSNCSSYPRAFVVPNAVPLPERSRILEALKTTDFSQTVLVEGIHQEVQGFALLPLSNAYVMEYRPYYVKIGILKGPHPFVYNGFLVFTDPWYPGWKCTIDGEPTQVYRADYLFRAVKVTASSEVVEF